ncbi:MAG: hypothetical protein QXD23_03525, partial [Candidatus Micrarchaeaceae archaeon]
MVPTKKVIKNTNKKTSKQQSAIEYVLSYSWAIIIVIAVVLIYFYYTNNQSTYTTSYCYISPELPCYQLVLNSNSSSVSALLVFSNNVGKPLYFSSSSFVIKLNPNSQYYTGYCQPTSAYSGTRIKCIANASGINFPIGTELSPEFYLTYSECISQNCNSNNKQLITLTTSGSGLSYIYKYNTTSNSINPSVITYTLTTNSVPTSSGSTSPLFGVYNSGEAVKISETPNIDYTFNDWSCTGVGCYSGTLTSPTIIMDSNIIETANFNQLPLFTLTTNSVPSNGGVVTPSSGDYYSGTQITISETPASGYIFTGWSCSGTNCYSGDSDSNVITINSNTVETANFGKSISTYTLTTNAVPSNGGTVLPANNSYQAGNSIIISETPALGYSFTGWSCSGIGCYSGSSQSNTIIIGANIVETANFQKQTGFYGPVPTFSCKTNDTYFYANTYGSQELSLISDKYQNTVLNNIGNSYYESNINYLTVSRGGYVYSLSKFYNDSQGSSTASLVIINTSNEATVKEALIQNVTANATLSSALQYSSNYEMYFNSSGSLYILTGDSLPPSPTIGINLVIINNTDIQNALSSSNLFYYYKKIQVKNITNIFNNSPNFGTLHFTSFDMLGNYAYITNSSNLVILNTTKNNSISKSIKIGNNTIQGASAGGIINTASNGNFMYFAIDNTTSNSTSSSGLTYNSVIAVLNTSSLKISYIPIAMSQNNYTVGTALSWNSLNLYVVLSNETVYTVQLTNNGLGSVTKIQNFEATDPQKGYDSLILSSGYQYNIIPSSNGTNLYVGTVDSGNSYYQIYNLNTGIRTGVLGSVNSGPVFSNPNFNADIVCAPQNNYNIYTTANVTSSTHTGIVGIFSTAYNVNLKNITLPDTFYPTTLLDTGNILKIGGYNYTSNDIYDQQALLTTANTSNDMINSNIIAPEANTGYFVNTGYPMTPETSTLYLTSISDFSLPDGNFFSTNPPYSYSNTNVDFVQTMSQAYPTNTVLSGLPALSSNTQASNCYSTTTCYGGNLYLTAYQTIDAFSSMASPSGSVCAAEGNYGFASTLNVYMLGILDGNNDMTTVSYQDQSQSEYSTISIMPQPGYMGATAAQSVFNYPLNDTIFSTYTSNGNSDIQNA